MAERQLKSSKILKTSFSLSLTVPKQRLINRTIRNDPESVFVDLSEINMISKVQGVRMTHFTVSVLWETKNEEIRAVVSSWQSESKKDAYFWFCWHF